MYPNEEKWKGNEMQGRKWIRKDDVHGKKLNKNQIKGIKNGKRNEVFGMENEKEKWHME